MSSESRAWATAMCRVLCREREGAVEDACRMARSGSLVAASIAGGRAMCGSHVFTSLLWKLMSRVRHPECIQRRGPRVWFLVKRDLLERNRLTLGMQGSSL